MQLFRRDYVKIILKQKISANSSRRQTHQPPAKVATQGEKKEKSYAPERRNEANIHLNVSYNCHPFRYCGAISMCIPGNFVRGVSVLRAPNEGLFSFYPLSHSFIPALFQLNAF